VAARRQADRARQRLRRRAVGMALLLLLAVLGFLFAVVYEEDATANAARAKQNALKESEQRDTAERQSFALTLQQVEALWNRDPNRGLELLADPRGCPPQLRDFTWGLYDRLCRRNLPILEAHRGRVEVVAYTPDGQLLATGGEDGTVKLWDVATGKEVQTFTGHEGLVRSLSISADGNRLASGAADGRANVWDVTARRRLLSLTPEAGLRFMSVALSPDGETLACATLVHLKLWDVGTGREKLQLGPTLGGACCVAFSPDGKTVASGGALDFATHSALVKLWDASTGELRLTFKGHSDTVWRVAFSPDGKTLASGGDDRTVRLWDVATGKEKATLAGHNVGVSCLAFRPDGAVLASCGAEPGGDGEVKLWDVRTGQERSQLRGDPSWGTAVAFSPDGKTLALASRLGTVKFRSPSGTQEEVSFAANQAVVRGLSFRPDGRSLAAADMGAVMLTHFAKVTAWAAADGKLLTSQWWPEGIIWATALSPDGNTLAAETQRPGQPFVLKLYDVPSGREITALPAHTVAELALAFGPDGRSLAALDADGRMHVWDVAARAELGAARGYQLSLYNCLAFSPDGQLLAASGPATEDQIGGVKLWDARTLAPRLAPVPYATAVSALAFSADGKTLAVATVVDNAVHLWDTITGKERAVLARHSGHVLALAFSPDGKTLASGSRDKTVKLWDAVKGQERATLTGHDRDVCSLVFSADGRRLASGGAHGAVKLWEANPPAPALKKPAKPGVSGHFCLSL
jgi:WD40 repeat protein